MEDTPRQSEFTSTGLLGQARDQDDEAWTRLVRDHSPLVYQWCRHFGCNSHDAADVMQDVFVSVNRNLNRFVRSKPGAFRSWLWTITHNKLRDLTRHRDPKAEGGSSALERWQNLPDEEPVSESVSVGGERAPSLLQCALDKARGHFAESTWNAFEMVVLKNRTAKEVASDLGLTTGAVYQARFRILHWLREELGDVLDLELASRE